MAEDLIAGRLQRRAGLRVKGCTPLAQQGRLAVCPSERGQQVMRKRHAEACKVAWKWLKGRSVGGTRQRSAMETSRADSKEYIAIYLTGGMQHIRHPRLQQITISRLQGRI